MAGKKKEAERVEDTPEVFENDIDLYLQMFCEQYGIEDMTQEPQSRWSAAMQYIYKNVFKNGCLKLQGKLEGYNNDVKGLSNSSCNAYDLDKVNRVADYYIYLCDLYDKGKTIMGFCYLTGINQDTIYAWDRDKDKMLSSAPSEIYQKLIAAYEDSGESKLWSNRNAVAQMAIQNRRFGWNLPGVSKEKAVSTARKPEEIEQMYGNEGKTAIPTLPED